MKGERELMHIPPEVNAMLKEGESVSRLDLSGWVVLKHLLSPGDTIIVFEGNRQPLLFGRAVRCEVRRISNNNLLGLRLLTVPVFDDRGDAWNRGVIDGWVDCMWSTWKVETKVKE